MHSAVFLCLGHFFFLIWELREGPSVQGRAHLFTSGSDSQPEAGEIGRKYCGGESTGKEDDI